MADNNVEFASINGVEVRNLQELDTGNEEDILFAGDVYLDGKKVGSFQEVPGEDEYIKLDIEHGYEDVLNSRVKDYLEEIEDEGEKLDSSIFFLDLIELERYLQMFKEGLEEGYGCLLVNFGEDGVDIFSIETEEDIEEVVRENNFEDFEVFSCLEHFVR